MDSWAAKKLYTKPTFQGKGQYPAASDVHWKQCHPLHQETHSRKTPSPLFSPSNWRSISPATKHEPTAGALRAARAIERDASLLKSLPELIDRETGVREVLEILETIIAEAGDIIEFRNPELIA